MECHFLPWKSFPLVSVLLHLAHWGTLGDMDPTLERIEFVIPAKLLDVLRILASGGNTLSFVIVVLLYSSSFLECCVYFKDKDKILGFVRISCQ